MHSMERFQRRLGRSMRLPQLELLAALDASRTMSEAAKSVRLSQPAASRLLRTLSDDLGITLFERSGRTIRPTAAGQALLRRSREIIAELDRAHEELAAIDQGLEGQVAVGSGIASCYVFLPKTIAALVGSNPNLAVTIREGAMEDLFPRLRQGSIDLLVGRVDDSGGYRDLVIEDLYDPSACVVAGPKHRLARKRGLRWDDLMALPWILPEFGTPMRTAIEGFIRTKRRRPATCLVESSSIQTNIGLLNHSDMLWVVSDDIANYFQDLGLAKILSVPKMPGPSPFIVAYKRNRFLSPAVQKLLDTLRTTAKSMNGHVTKTT